MVLSLTGSLVTSLVEVKSFCFHGSKHWNYQKMVSICKIGDDCVLSCS